MRLERLFLERCETHADRTFVVDHGVLHSYRDVARHARVMASRLSEIAPKGSRVALVLRTGEGFVAAFFGALLAGCTVMPIDPRLVEPEVAFLVAHGDVSVVVVDSVVPARGFACPVLRMRDAAQTPPLATDDTHLDGDLDRTAIMLATSGSTSSPRVVELSHRNVLTNARAWNARYSIVRDDVVATPLAACHSFGLTACLLAALDAGASVVTCSDPLPAIVASAIAASRATVLVAASSFHPWLARSHGVPRDALSSVRLVLGGACPLSTSSSEAFQEKFGLPVLETYGLTEASPVVTATAPGTARRGSVGTALDGLELRVVAEELQVRGATVMRGYWRNPSATAAVVDADGWLATGDAAHIDADGYVTILGRQKDLILRGGEKIYPEEIEEALTGHPDVTDAAVIGEHDATSGEVTVAFVTVRGALDPESLIAFCRTRLAAFKVPRRIEVVPNIPRNPNGKVLRRLLRERPPLA
jgi:long-chain acyl-CoA synthetase